MSGRPGPAVVLRGGTLVDETGERRADVLVRDDLIAELSPRLSVPAGATVLDAAGCYVAPGLVDLHTHLREPGFEDAESIETGSRAASLGGFTAVIAMPNTDPPLDNAAVAVEVLSKGEAATCHVGVAGAITVGRRGEHLAPIGELAELGVRMFTDDGTGVQDAAVMRRALEYAHGLRERGMDVVLAQHCEDRSLSEGTSMNEGAWSSRLGVPGSPAEAEELMVARDIALARLTGGRVHLLHLSTSGSLDMVRAAKASGVALSAEVAPHHLSLTDANLVGFDPVFKVNPPLRTAEDVFALRCGCGDGSVDAIATDHAPHVAEAKERPLDEAAPGIIGLETALGVAVDSLCAANADGAGAGELERNHEVAPMSVGEVLGLMSWRPARIAGLSAAQGGEHGGPLAEGAPANLCVFDPEERWVVDPARFASRSRNCPWAGRTLRGRVRHTIYRGEPVVIDLVAQR